ncbi:hypothetical protein O181_028158 [Austropuccinia psidii MF-1]|uniref:GH16 domain-containing protein n=1 Tax=Austropuccinia psidii MF-1 TaxID=1389203 RepID=A0A9Q3CT72_9BASI|nr:hypothetical protein [Austropuccinia psidii MF-1]
MLSNHSKNVPKQVQRTSINSSSVASTDSWKQTGSVQGNDLIDFFMFENFATTSDGGVAQYVTGDEASKSGMVQVQGDSVRFNVDTTPHVDGVRKSIRVSSKNAFNAGTMLIIDVEHMPAACGVWPALWTTARDGSWPEKGEIDIIEGVNLLTYNSLSAHTKPGFVMEENGFSSKFLMSSDQKNNCDAKGTNDQGCGLSDPVNGTYGTPFNQAHGGVFVMDWTEKYITLFFFERGNIPEDIAAGNPSKTASWRQSTPRAKFQDINGQSTSTYFIDHVLVLNTNLCGQWPSDSWGTAPYSGQSTNCAEMTGHDSCSSYVLSSGDQLGEAYWSIHSIKTYQ